MIRTCLADQGELLNDVGEAMLARTRALVPDHADPIRVELGWAVDDLKFLLSFLMVVANLAENLDHPLASVLRETLASVHQEIFAGYAATMGVGQEVRS